MPSECFVFSSNPANGAINRSPTGSKFSVQLTNPIYLPDNAYNAKLEVIQSSIWNNSPNISQVLNNNTMTVQDTSGPYTVIIPDGLYDIDILYDTLALLFDNLNPRPQFPFKDMFDIEGNDATNRIYIVFKYTANDADPEILWSSSTINSFLGFDASSPTKPAQPSTASHNSSITADDPAKFNAYNSFVIKSDIVNTGIQINDNFNGTIAQIQITSNPGEIQNFRATEPNIFSLCNNLIGINSARYTINFELVSETGVPLDTRGEYYDFVLMLSWLEDQ